MVHLEFEVGKESQEQMVRLAKRDLLAHVQWSVRLGIWESQGCQETQDVVEVQVRMCATSFSS